MRILQVAPRLSLEHGGGGVVIVNSLAKALAAKGHIISILTSDFGMGGRFVFSSWDDGVCVVSDHSFLTIGTLHVTPGTIDSAKLVVPIFDVIHMQGCRTFQNIVVSRYAKKYGIPYIVDAHGFPVEGTLLRRLFIRLFDALFANRLVRGAEFCIAETQVGVEEYKRAGVDESKIVVIPCPYDLSLFDNLPYKGEFKRKYDIDSKKIVLFVGALDYIKGLDFLVESFARLKREDAVLVLVGPDGGYEKTLRKMVVGLGIEDKVIFTGYLGGADKLEALVDADIAVFPSRAEQGLPFAALEAIMCGTAVIVTHGTGSAQDVQKMACGWSVYPELLDGRIERALLSSQHTGKYATQGRAYIRKNLSMAKKVKEYEELYKRCIDAD